MNGAKPSARSTSEDTRHVACNDDQGKNGGNRGMMQIRQGRGGGRKTEKCSLPTVRVPPSINQAAIKCVSQRQVSIEGVLVKNRSAFHASSSNIKYETSGTLSACKHARWPGFFPCHMDAELFCHAS